MLTDENYEEFLKLYKQKNLRKGIRSVLLIGGPDDDLRFFETYFKMINEIGHEDWHVIGFSKPTNLIEQDLSKIKWEKSNNSYKYARQLTAALRKSRFSIPRSSFVFYNPLRENIFDNVVIWEFDFVQIFDRHYAESLFHAILRYVRNELTVALSNKQKFEAADYDAILDGMRRSRSDNYITFEARRFFDTITKVLQSK